ncbi:type 1 glutamine amidotransferase [Vermiphilus pyriformis]|jgi:protease I|nr:MAG: type 1 glutamine amidotransferase [Vermiphilus pyriformis]
MFGLFKDDTLSGIKVALLATEGFEQSELVEPKKALEYAGAKVDIISLQAGTIKGWKNKNWGDDVTVDLVVTEANPEDYHGLLLPGGVMNPDILRADEHAVEFVKHFVDSNKPIAAICHGPWTLINAHGVNRKTVTSWLSLKQDLINAGAAWVDQQVVQDGKLITSRKPDDIPAFNKTFIELLSAHK